MSKHVQPSRWNVVRGVFIAFVFMLGQGCATPVFSDFQTARVAQQGEWELTPVVAHLPSLGQTNAGLQAAVGVGSNVELRARYVRAFTRQLIEDDTRFFGHRFDDLGGDFSHASLGLKFSLMDGVLAAHLPVEVAFAAGSESAVTTRPVPMTVRPTLIATVPVSEAMEVNSSFNVILPPALASVNLGLGIGDLGRWAVRPEVGVMLNTGFVSTGVGLAYRFGGPAGGL